MTYHNRIESSELTSFMTTRTRNSALWFVNNARLELSILGLLAKCAERYQAKVYAFAMEGSHEHTQAQFPGLNRADFKRDFNSGVAVAVKNHNPECPEGGVWARRYSVEFTPEEEDIENWFFYTVLQPVKDGLVERLSEYPGYNCFHDAVHGVRRKFKIVRRGEYNAARRYKRNVSIADYTDEYFFQYERLPGYEHLSQAEYAKLMHQKLERRRLKIVRERRSRGLGFVGRTALLAVQPGTPARNPKTSTRYSFKPRILCVNSERLRYWLDWYFEIFYAYREASSAYRGGNFEARFPDGTYKPYLKAPLPPPS